MPSFHLEDLSSFGRLAVKLDGLFSELTRISGQLERLDIDSDSGLDRAVKLLNQFAEHGNTISEDVQGFSKVLQEARARSEAAAKQVAERAQAIHQRKQQQNELREKLGQVEQNVTTANASLADFRKNGKSEFTPDEKGQIRAKLEGLNEELKRFLAEVQGIKDAAARSNFKSIEHDAKKLLEALRASCRRIDKAVGEQ